jgi:UDP-MurNAc hydroxylase
MKFTILSHAGLCVEHNGVRIVSDPWLAGSCYWRSWWNLPEPPLELISDLRPNYLYLTHLHWDHFHGASLKRFFALTTRILVPKITSTRMLRDLRWLGFDNITEIPHGSSLTLGDDFTLHSYQFNFVTADSAMILTGGATTLFNCNDCKLFGWPLQQIAGAHPRIDFVLRSHSSATPIPYCIEGYREMFPKVRSQHDYIDEFSRFALHVGARYAIPFASNHCFLHKETLHFNDTAVLPDQVRSHYQRLAARSGIESECVVMAPGSSWSDREGFSLAAFDYAARGAYIESLRTIHEEQLTAQYDKEESAVADFAAFRGYFLGLIRAIPWIVRRLSGLSIVFRTRDSRGEHRWLVDIANGKVEETPAAGRDTVEIETAPLILNDCASIMMFSAWTPSKRLRIRLPGSAHLSTVTLFLSLLDLYELEVLPLRKNLSWRAISVRARRWRELLEAGRFLLNHLIMRRPINANALYPLPPETSSEASN